MTTAAARLAPQPLSTAGSPATRQFVLRDIVQPSDRESVRTIVSATGFFLPDEVKIALELVDERLARGVESGYEFVFAELESQTVGYACYGSIPCTISSFDLYWIAVDPEYQRHGVGRELLAAVESRIFAAGGERIYVDTSGKQQYAPTRAFYERRGFQCAARLTDFYSPGDDRVIYAKVLGSRT